ncbi:MAG: hypothetical protein ACJ8IQ_02370 [Chthoniobacterales bacterium]
MPKRTKVVGLTVLAGVVWAGSITAGISLMLNYERTAGSAGTVRSDWPADSALQLAPDRATLLVFAHPRCPCTRATMSELAEVVTHTHGKLRASVVFFAPPDAGRDWYDTELQREAAAIPGVSVISDREGTEARRFGVETSGHALLFAADGRLLFQGGITASRGHEGANAGENAIVAIVNGRAAPQNKTLVFGCSLGDRKQLANATTP